MEQFPFVKIENPQAAPATVVVGSGVWKIVDSALNLDLILSIESKNFLIMLNFLADYG